MTRISKIFLLLLSILFVLNVVDIILTVPEFEGNPLAIWSWEHLGYWGSVVSKLLLVVGFGMIAVVVNRVLHIDYREKAIVMTALSIMAALLILFYVFVVAYNISLQRMFSETATFIYGGAMM